MSVIVQNDNNFTLFAKGSPEKMKAIFKNLP
jgi:magnesium-transporting ATPase (P-type)